MSVIFETQQLEKLCILKRFDVLSDSIDSTVESSHKISWSL